MSQRLIGSATMQRINGLVVTLLVVGLVAVGVSFLPARPPPQSARTANNTKPDPKDPSEQLFDGGRILELRIQVKPKQLERLQNDNRRFVECSLIEDGTTTYEKVAVKLKGAAGSFRDLSDRPAFTLKMKKEGERFHGLDKFHLNNSVQDESYLNELICSQVFREAGYPATRVTHARVWLNDRDLGFYVLKEGFDRPFLVRNFGDAKGNLYDGGFCVDIDTMLEKDEGEGPDDHSDLQSLVAACREADEEKRWSQVEEKLDVEAFLTFMALELMACHWDGYVQACNNYRLYFRDKDKRAVFIPHGTDQMFQDPGFGVFPSTTPVVVGGVMSNPKWRARYQERVTELLPHFERERLHAKIDAARKRIRPVLARLGDDRAQQFDEQVQGMKDRVADRAKNIAEQRPPEPLTFDDGPVPLGDWAATPADDAVLELQEIEGKACYLLKTGPSNQCVSSFRRMVLLARGRYRLEAQARCEGVAPLTDEKGQGLGLRLGGGTRKNHLEGTTKWKPLTFDFEVEGEQQQVELVCELRSTAGEAFVEVDSLRLSKLE